MPQGAGFSGDRGGQMQRGPAKPVLRGNRPLSTGGKWIERPPGGLYTKGEMPPGPPFAYTEDDFCYSPAPSKKKRVYGRNMVPPVRSRAARYAVPPGVSAETPAIRRELSPQATEGENSQSVCSGYPLYIGSVYLSLRQTLWGCHLPRQREARQKTGDEGTSDLLLPLASPV